MGIECKIQLSKRSDEQFKPGDVVDGKVQYTLDNEIVVNEVILKLKGKAKCSWTEQHGQTAVHYVGTERIFAYTLSLVQQTPPDGKTLIERGSYTHDFEFVLSEQIPYTFEKSKSKYIIYSLKLVFVKPEFYKKNHSFRKIIKIAPFVDLTTEEYSATRKPASFTLTKVQNQFFSKVGKMTSTVSVPRTAFIPEETIPVTYQVHNNTKLTLPCVKTKVVQITKYTATQPSNRVRTRECTIYKAPPSEAIQAGEQRCDTSNLLLPLESPPTLLHCRVLALNYVVRFRVCYPGMRIDAKLDVPIMIGSPIDNIGHDKKQKESENPITSTADDPGMSSQPPAYVPPPSYWEVMQLDENEEEDELIK